MCVLTPVQWMWQNNVATVAINIVKIQNENVRSQHAANHYCSIQMQILIFLKCEATDLLKTKTAEDIGITSSTNWNGLSSRQLLTKQSRCQQLQ